MKKKQLIAFLSIILCFLMFSGFFKSKTEKYIEYGDKALMKNDFETAYENYRKAGDAGKDKLIIAYLREIRYYDAKISYGQKRTVEDVLEDIEKEEKDKALYADVLITWIREMQEDGENNRKILDIIDRVPSAYQSKVADIKEQILKEELEESIRLAESGGSWDRLLEIFQEHPEHEKAKPVLDVYEQLSTRPTVEAAVSLRKLYPIEKTKTFWKYATKNYKPNTLDDVIELYMAEKALYNLYPEDSEKQKSLTEIYDPNTRVVWMGIDRREDNETLTDKMVEELKNNCGKEAEGKILIIHDRADYGTKDREIDIAWNQMDNLPNAWKPLSVKQVKYLIYVKSDYTKGGVYSGGTQQIHETSKLSLYDTETGKVLFSKTVRGKSSNVMVYYGSRRPLYYSDESPDMCTAFRDAMKKITNLEK